jgi:hypothetical protein
MNSFGGCQGFISVFGNVLGGIQGFTSPLKVGGGAHALTGNGAAFGGVQTFASPLKVFGGVHGWPVYICWANTARLTVQRTRNTNIDNFLFIKS